MQDWQTVKTKTSNINKLVEDTRMVSCETRFSLLSLGNKVDISYNEIHDNDFNYSSKTSNKSNNINSKHPQSKERGPKKIRLISDSHRRK